MHHLLRSVVRLSNKIRRCKGSWKVVGDGLLGYRCLPSLSCWIPAPSEKLLNGNHGVPVKFQITKRAKNWMLASAVSIGILGCHQSSPWNGNWKLIPSNSSVPGPNFTITLTPTGEYQTDNGTIAIGGIRGHDTYSHRAIVPIWLVWAGGAT